MATVMQTPHTTDPAPPAPPARFRSAAGFTLAELMIAMAVMLIISGAVTGALLQMTNAQRTIWNRTEMHSGVRGATELLQQEVGQAGRVALPATVTLSAAVLAGANPVNVSSSAGMFVGEQLVIGGGSTRETVSLTAVGTSPASITANFANAHASGDPVQVLGGFSAGIVPPTTANGSTGTVLKMFGDINGDNSMVYIEYTCDTTAKNLYRNAMAWNASTPKPTPGAAQVLLGNIITNPGGAPCFTYETATVNGITYVIDVAITLTVQTQQIDPITNSYQTETKALLNVAPRNIFNVWLLASSTSGGSSRIQPTPATITALLP
jgi:prepilin-type N-terminal cleavage/methylation domain-containing protein